MFYPGPQYRGGRGGAAGEVPGPSKVQTSPNDSGISGVPALGFLPPPPPMPTLAPPPLAPAVGAGGAGGAAAGALRGAFSGGLDPRKVLAGAVIGAGLGYLGWEVASWDYTPKVMWMPPGFYKHGWLHDGCPQWVNAVSQPYGAYAQGTGPFSLLGPGPDCAGVQFESGNAMGTGFVAATTEYIVITRKHRVSYPPFVVPWEEWRRPFPGVGVPAPNAVPFPAAQPDGVPWLDPASVPMGVPTPSPKPPPHRFATPRPGEAPPKPRPKEWPDTIVTPPVTAPIVEVPPLVGLPPVVGPIIIIDPTNPGPNPDPAPDPDPGGGTAPKPPPGSRAPPRENESHHKINVKNVVHPGVHLALNQVTEGLDLVRELYKAVPKKCRHAAGVKTNRPSVAEKMKVIWHCRNSINMAEALANVLNNQFEDWVYGKLGRQTGKATRNLNLTTGLNRALRAAQSAANPEGETILPELFVKNGVWGVRWNGYEAMDPYGRGPGKRDTDFLTENSVHRTFFPGG